ncbi:hypothetical protein TG4357_02998 [Thalassovita gelatinovora]|uniref:CAAX amino terminal protease self-immunity n=1 Tax=Thalassovita gelatinovora TaxID=53501 RepID=A0A0P1FHC8_THAGE|nr:hypothetical protein [Thalassovita gelatinovora]QIZ81983.1 hypothetical protein HFZ77_16620 [Thalassovita gelatinovora]CUH67421.1 hypothetical protein TG4357_02998 [Thalassovita gelatinovora]SEP74348.1 hypothetical protein SAMN04488043_101261 [Thalassovita gelatinovora]
MLFSPVQTEAPETGDQDTTAPGQVIRAVLIVAVLWLVSSQTYYALVAALDLERGYDGAPVLFTAYYLAWAAISLWLFRSLIVGKLNRSTVAREGLVMLPILVCFALFVVYVLPLLPKVSELRAPSEPPEFMFASAWYYLPKSADILFQQVLAAALILTAARAGYGIIPIAIGMAAAFGGFHLLLVFDGFTPVYVTRFTLSATVFGALLPYLYLRVRSGFRWAYSLHWGFYAFDATVTHFILAAPPWV